jgi:hypothetical protein
VRLAALSALDPASDVTGRAARRGPGGTPTLAYDDELSRLFASATRKADAAQLTERFLAETVVLLGEFPGIARTVLVAAPRSFDPDPTALGALFDGVSTAPWISVTSTDTLQRLAADPRAPMAAPAGQHSDPLAGPHSVSPATQASPLDSPATASIWQALQDLRRFGGVLPAEDPSLRSALEAQEAVASTRWRSQPQAWSRARTSADAATRSLLDGVQVQPAAVNFFADTGVLQVTVINTLNSDVQGVTLRVEPGGRGARLRVAQQPAPVQIRKNSRTTIRVPVEAVAPGLATLTARLTGPDGAQLGQESLLRVQVQPANGWVLLVVGGLAGGVFVAGMYRALRAGTPRVPKDQLDQLDLS